VWTSTSERSAAPAPIAGVVTLPLDRSGPSDSLFTGFASVR
jgi:hypothetical protein